MTAPKGFPTFMVSLSLSLSLHPYCGPLDALFLEQIQNAPWNNVDVCDNLLDNLYAFFPLSATILRFPICLRSRNSRLSQRCSMFHIPLQMAQSAGLSTSHWT